MNKGKGLILFAAGAVIGSLATWLVIKKRYEKLVQEEIDSVKKAFSNNNEPDTNSDNVDKDEDDDDEDCVDEDKDEYNNLLVKEGYSEEDKDIVKCGEPYVISPEEFGELADYKLVTLTYYSDGTLADDSGEIINITETVGQHAMTCFGDYVENMVHVRNDVLKTDYEVLLDESFYSEVYTVTSK